MNIHSLTDFLDKAQCQFRIYDLGRKVTKISASDFKKVELNQVPYPYPLQQHAWVAVVFWQVNNPQHYIWFLKLPLDERGLLLAGPQTHFIQLVVEALGASLEKQPDEKQQERLANNPYTFKPAEHKTAVFHAKLNLDLVRPASRYYEQAHAYFSGQLDWQQWQQLGMQGIADVAVRLKQDDNETHIGNALTQLPDTPLCILLEALEHQNMSTQLTEKLVELAQAKLADKPQVATLALRAISSSKAKGLRQMLLKQQLASSLGQDPQWFIAVAARCWQDLVEPDFLAQYLEQLAVIDHGQLFVQLFADLVAQPELRHLLLGKIREPERSPALNHAIGLLFG
ncbi:DUF3549 family protein [Motilimonas sp. E26]|uniref:DUF3549 family protein n=1 Tax=Motilimonas sp. E26 TaxID=2865674 RepID=UPI001E5CD60B|nr:DUF3549 family protein [Motilimonas sp. E26]MCE0556073.1 DUF3549 family protein [Motilimonas sp. E26]